MIKEKIEIQLIHEPKTHPSKFDFDVRVFMNDDEYFVNNLSESQLLDISSILINASSKLIKLYKDKQHL